MRLPVLLRPEELEVKTFALLVRMMSRLEHRLEQELEQYSLSLAQFDILATLGLEEGITQQELAERLLVTKGNVCGMMARMEASGWVKRQPDAGDRRVNHVFLTRRGKALLMQTLPTQQDRLRAVLGVLDPRELQLLYQLLDRLDAAIDL